MSAKNVVILGQTVLLEIYSDGGHDTRQETETPLGVLPKNVIKPTRKNSIVKFTARENRKYYVYNVVQNEHPSSIHSCC